MRVTVRNPAKAVCQKGLDVIHPDVSLAFINDAVGFGLIASRPLPAGTITWCQDALDICLTPERLVALGPLYDAQVDRYAWTDAQGDRILCWDIGRYMNHGCRANSMSPGLSFEVALRDIAAGEEILCDYGTLNLDAGFDCACGFAGCRGRVKPRDFDTYAEVWDAQLQAVFPRVMRVPQALGGLLDADAHAAIAGYAAQPTTLPGVRAHQCVAPQPTPFLETPRALPALLRPLAH